MSGGAHVYFRLGGHLNGPAGKLLAASVPSSSGAYSPGFRRQVLSPHVQLIDWAPFSAFRPACCARLGSRPGLPSPPAPRAARSAGGGVPPAGRNFTLWAGNGPEVPALGAANGAANRLTLSSS